MQKNIKRTVSTDVAMLHYIKSKPCVLFANNHKDDESVFVKKEAFLCMERNAGNDKFYILRSAVEEGSEEGYKSRGAVLGRKSKLTGEYFVFWGPVGVSRPTLDQAVKKKTYNFKKKHIEAILTVFRVQNEYHVALKVARFGSFFGRH